MLSMDTLYEGEVYRFKEGTMLVRIEINQTVEGVKSQTSLSRPTYISGFVESNSIPEYRPSIVKSWLSLSEERVQLQFVRMDESYNHQIFRIRAFDQHMQALQQGYTVGQIAQATILKYFQKSGVFVQLEDGVVGLMSVSHVPIQKK